MLWQVCAMVAQCSGILRKSGRLPLPSGLAGTAAERAALAPTPGKRNSVARRCGPLASQDFFRATTVPGSFDVSTGAQRATRGLRGIAVHG
jgi:hypothetical protein